jgi:hypothetical protein
VKKVIDNRKNDGLTEPGERAALIAYFPEIGIAEYISVT